MQRKQPHQVLFFIVKHVRQPKSLRTTKNTTYMEPNSPM